MHIIIIIIVAIMVYYSFIAFQKFDCFLWRVARRAEREGRRERGESVLLRARGTLVITRVNTTLSTIPSTEGITFLVFLSSIKTYLSLVNIFPTMASIFNT